MELVCIFPLDLPVKFSQMKESLHLAHTQIKSPPELDWHDGSGGGGDDDDDDDDVIVSHYK